MDLAVPVLSYPKRSLGPREARVSTTAGRGNCAKHASARGIDLLDTILCDLKYMPAVECGSSMRSDIERTNCFSASRIEGVQLVSGRKPDVLAVIGDSIHSAGTWKGTVLSNNFGA